MDVSLFLNETYGFVRMPTQDQVMRSSKAILIIAGADGLAPEELEYVLAISRSFGLPESQLAELRSFDYRKARLADYLKDDIRPSARCFLYDAIRAVCADAEYSDRERKKMAAAAEALGIDRKTLATIEALVETERAQRRLRVSVLFPSRS